MDVMIRIGPDGANIIMLYYDHNPLNTIGEKRIVRASDVKYDNQDGLWHVYEIMPGREMVRHKQGFKLRADAIKYEIGLLEAKLGGDASGIVELFREVGE